jgi:hypothetical protein
MRASALRQLAKQQAQLPQAQGYSVPAPVGGLNVRDALANMPETDAIILDNWFPQPTWVEVRGGTKKLATFTGISHTVASYNALTGTNLLFAAAINAGTGSLYRVDNSAGGPGTLVVGGAGPLIQAITGDQYDWSQFGTGAAEILYLVNGLDSPLLYDGTNWQGVTSSSAPYAMTGGPSADNHSLNQVVRYKNRLWFVQANSFNVYYLPQNVFAGALTLLNMGPNFNQGGYLAAIATNSIDNAAGFSDYIAFISNQGEVVMYQGYDPGSVSTWYETGHFQIGRPLAIGRRTWTKIGTDAVVLCVDGAVPLSKAMVSDRSQPLIALTDKIRKGIKDAASNYGTVYGWQLLLYPGGTKLVVNVPTQVNTASFQYVQNTISGAWCSFGLYNSPWNAICFERMGDNLYYTTSGAVFQCDTGQSDNGLGITIRAKPAFSYLNDREHLKIFTQCQPIFQVTGSATFSVNLNVDFSSSAPTSTIPVSSGNATQWGSPWGSPWGDATQIVKPWIGLDDTGYCMSMQLQTSVLNIGIEWQATNYLYKTGGLFYGIRG